jgi:hypothetical protein
MKSELEQVKDYMTPPRPITIEAMETAQTLGVSAYLHHEDIGNDPYTPQMKGMDYNNPADRDELHTLRLSALVWRIAYRGMKEKAER